jgi:hypothetical protein
VAVPLASVDAPFMFAEVTADFQEVTVQGQVTYRVAEPRKLAGLLNFTLGPDQRTYVSDDPEKLPVRVVNAVQVLMRDALEKRPLKEALRASEHLVATLRPRLAACDIVVQLGLEILDLSLLAIKPNPETARALEAEVREQLLMESDEAIYVRRNFAVEQERAIKENELNTDIAVEHKRRQIRETKIDADHSVAQRRQAMREEELAGKITLEEERGRLVSLAVDNRKAEADAQAYGMRVVVEAFKGVEPKVMQALATAGMEPAQLIATAFQNLADNAGKIGNLNIAPELLQELLGAASPPRFASRTGEALGVPASER